METDLFAEGTDGAVGCTFLAESNDFVVCFDIRQQIAVTCRELRTRPNGDVGDNGRE